MNSKCQFWNGNLPYYVQSSTISKNFTRSLHNWTCWSAKLKPWNPWANASSWYSWNLTSWSTLYYSNYSTIVTFAYFTIRKRFPYANAFFTEFLIEFSRKIYLEKTAQYYFGLLPCSHYQLTDWNPWFHGIMLKLISTWFLAFEKAMLQNFSNFYQYTLKNFNSRAYTMQNSPQDDKPLPLDSFVLHWNFKTLQISDKLKQLCDGHSKIVNMSTEITYEFLTQEEKTFHTHLTHLVSYYPKEPLLFPHIKLYKKQNLEKKSWFWCNIHDSKWLIHFKWYLWYRWSCFWWWSIL